MNRQTIQRNRGNLDNYLKSREEKSNEGFFYDIQLRCVGSSRQLSRHRSLLDNLGTKKFTDMEINQKPCTPFQAYLLGINGFEKL